MKNRKKLVVITFAALTLVLAVMAVVISVRLIQDQRPTDSAAASCTPGATNDAVCGGSAGDKGCSTDRKGYSMNCIALSPCLADGTTPGPTVYSVKYVEDTARCDAPIIVPPSCASGKWNVYKCNYCNFTGTGCQDKKVLDGVSESEARAYADSFAQETVCAHIQADCVGAEAGKAFFQVRGRGCSGNICIPPKPCEETNTCPPVTTTTSKPPANVCVALRRVNPTSTALIDSADDRTYTVTNGTQMRFRARYTCQNGLRDKFKLLVFPEGNQAGVLGTPLPPVSWNPTISVVNEGNDNCLYFYDWQATGLQAGITYKVRIVNVGNDNTWNTGDDIEGDVDCRKNLVLEAASSSSTPTSTPTSSSTSSSSTSSSSTSSSTTSSSTSSSSTSSSTTSSSSSTTTTPPTCGQPCGANGQTCTNGHACLNNVCVTNYCLANPSRCQADMCTPKGSVLPSTGLFDQGFGPLLLGGLLVLFGILLNRYNFVLRSLGYDKLAIKIFGNTEETYASGVEKTVRADKKRKSKK